MATKPYFYQKDRLELRDAVRKLCSQFSLDYWEEHDRTGTFPDEFAQAFADAGFKGIIIPEEYGGGGGKIGDLLAVMEEVTASGGGNNASSSIQIPLLCVPSLLAFGTEEQKREFLPKIASGELFVTFGVTEPDAGTDTTQITTTATPTDGGWLINGTKVWNSGALVGNKVMLLVRTSKTEPDGRKGDGLTLFLTDLQVPTIAIKKIPKIGRNAVASAELFISDHFVRPEEVVGEVGKGFYHLLHSLNGERLILSAVALGMGRWAVENATRYANERVVFGRPIGKNQAVQHPLARGHLNLLAASEVLKRAAEEYELNGPGSIGGLANAAKYLATEAAFAASDDAMQVFGGYSFAREYHIGRHWIESRLQRIAPINNQMILNYIAERELGLPRSY
ncbi:MULTISPECIES: acyl-CoA dehydrogenase family protein [Rhodococcus]|uniref:Acyl-CoA dehydrogenase domain-containing protein n=1 Tax=Rhodococcus opacus RKJ300 = JCM 13270 TaxID=1165867 RepID=I0WKQ8_RHOOP|nr:MULTISPECIES: acyl-CoA dehydrogenase family protein [Rhodococcus]EID76974.1 acyl-CoA dehydrogenase domain-containing protein [Rhodococcus opacus RKJ300 = JCM 13270]QQZ18849.1 acyl-CoA/acyl-ACP dehydrogenase [Rhodococcus sp. 21391]